MIEVHAFTFYGILAVAGLGLIQSAYVLWGTRQAQETGFLKKPDAPEGFEWVLMEQGEADKWRARKTH